jgi:hypothetical protein
MQAKNSELLFDNDFLLDACKKLWEADIFSDVTFSYNCNRQEIPEPIFFEKSLYSAVLKTRCTLMNHAKTHHGKFIIRLSVNIFLLK